MQTSSPPPRKPVTFTHEQFYEKVWSAPATRLAAGLGVSDVMLGKICRDHDIPKPYPGYWARLHHGKKRRKPRLPPNDDPQLQTLTFEQRSGAEAPPDPEPAFDPDIRALLDRALALGPLKVADTLRNLHPLVAATRDQDKQVSVPFHLQPHDAREDDRPTVCVSASKAQYERALRIMDALIKRVEKLGGRIEVREQSWRRHRTETVVCFAGETVSVIRLREKHRRVRVPKAEREFQWKESEMQPTGLLVLDDGTADHDGVLLQDTKKKHRIEDGLNDLVLGFIRQAGHARIDRRLAEAAQRREEEVARVQREQEEALRRRREAFAERQHAEQSRVDELLDHAAAWRQCEMVRDYLAAVTDMLLERDGSIALDGEAADYLKWAHQQADRLDPLRPSPPSVLDETT